MLATKGNSGARDSHPTLAIQFCMRDVSQKLYSMLGYVLVVVLYTATRFKLHYTPFSFTFAEFARVTVHSWTSSAERITNWHATSSIRVCWWHTNVIRLWLTCFSSVCPSASTTWHCGLCLTGYSSTTSCSVVRNAYLHVANNRFQPILCVSAARRCFLSLPFMTWSPFRCLCVHGRM